MPRGVKKSPISIDEQIAEVQTKIDSYQSKISNLNAKKKMLLASKEKAEVDALYQFVKQSGKTPAELLAELSK